MKLTILIDDFLQTAYFERKSRRFTQECRDALSDFLDVTGDIDFKDITLDMIKAFIRRETRLLERKRAVRRYIVIRAFVKWASGFPSGQRPVVVCLQ